MDIFEAIKKDLEKQTRVEGIIPIKYLDEISPRELSMI